MAPATDDHGDSAVRNVVLVAGHDFLRAGMDFDAHALRRIRSIFDGGERDRFPLRFHLLSAATGVVAESVVLEQDANLSGDSDPSNLSVGGFWQRVERRFRAVTTDRLPTVEEARRPIFEPQDPRDARVMSIDDVYQYLHSFWEHGKAVSPRAPAASDCLLELSFFCHASVEGVLLIRADGGKPDGVADLNRLGRSFWERIAAMFVTRNGRVRLWGGALTPASEFYQRLLQQTIASPAYTQKKGYMGLSSYGSALASQKTLADGDAIFVTDSKVREELLLRGVDPSKLTFGAVKSLVEEAERISYARAIAEALRVGVLFAPPGTEAAVEKGQLRIPERYRDVVDFYLVHLGRTVDLEGLYLSFSPRSAVQTAAPTAPGASKRRRSPLSGFRLFSAYRTPNQEHKPFFKTNKILQETLVSALSKKPSLENRDPKRSIAIAIAHIGKVNEAHPDKSALNTDLPYAGVHDDEVHYSGSLLKVAALYAAHQLRDVVNELAQRLSAPTEQEPLQRIAAHIDPILLRSMDLWSKPVAKRARAEGAILPTYGAIFEVNREASGSRSKFKFSGKYAKDVEQMITVGHNDTAMRCIHGLGYAWINCLLQFGGFPRIWLAGDYSEEKQWPSVRVPSLNDGPVAQAMTAHDMAALFALIWKRSQRPPGNPGGAQPDAGATEMLAYLRQARDWSEPPNYVTYDKVAAKIGLGELKNKLEILSEGSIRSAPVPGDPDSKHLFVIVWQNLPNTEGDLDELAVVITQAVNAYIAHL